LNASSIRISFHLLGLTRTGHFAEIVADELLVDPCAGLGLLSIEPTVQGFDLVQEEADARLYTFDFPAVAQMSSRVVLDEFAVARARLLHRAVEAHCHQGQHEVGDDDVEAPVREKMSQPSHCQSAPKLRATKNQAKVKG